MKEIRKNFPYYYYNSNNNIKSLNAYCVLQGQFTISAKELIGTINVHNCVCVIIHNPESKETALAHIDSLTNLESLHNIMKQLNYNNSTQYQVRIIGARYYNCNNQHLKDTSQNNLKKVFNFLSQYNVNIISADICNFNQHTNIVVNPQTFELYNQYAKRKIAHSKPLFYFSYLFTSYDIYFLNQLSSAEYILDKDTDINKFNKYNYYNTKNSKLKTDHNIYDIMINLLTSIAFYNIYKHFKKLKQALIKSAPKIIDNLLSKHNLPPAESNILPEEIEKYVTSLNVIRIGHEEWSYNINYITEHLEKYIASKKTSETKMLSTNI